MFRIYDRPEAIRRVQDYLIVAGNPDIFVAPTGVFDENTRLSVIDFQAKRGIEPTGVVDYETFNIIYREYVFLNDTEELNRVTDSFIGFPILPGDLTDEMIHINRSMRRILDYYGFTNTLSDSNFYSQSTSDAVLMLREVYMLDLKDEIDEEFYLRMIKDHDSIGKFNNNFR